MAILKTKICKKCNASFVPDIYCSGDYCNECNNIKIVKTKRRKKKLQKKRNLLVK